ncbi:UNKNOWN [Stylonychia lemnae]|uniref:Uncharacterized protein n=1 Tax=Stylonychia lemnae TaxID=5949 RepID=A0A078BBW6_STYLE|nr:UNKNOWN [Stylonychia lemnae]|eukprot:CDW91701.1 UNKNOWN [Stylonychia lemnae]
MNDLLTEQLENKTYKDICFPASRLYRVLGFDINIQGKLIVCYSERFMILSPRRKFKLIQLVEHKFKHTNVLIYCRRKQVTINDGDQYLTYSTRRKYFVHKNTEPINARYFRIDPQHSLVHIAKEYEFYHDKFFVQNDFNHQFAAKFGTHRYKYERMPLSVKIADKDEILHVDCKTKNQIQELIRCKVKYCLDPKYFQGKDEEQELPEGLYTAPNPEILYRTQQYKLYCYDKIKDDLYLVSTRYDEEKLTASKLIMINSKGKVKKMLYQTYSNIEFQKILRFDYEQNPWIIMKENTKLIMFNIQKLQPYIIAPQINIVDQKCTIRQQLKNGKLIIISYCMADFQKVIFSLNPSKLSLTSGNQDQSY